MGKKSKLPSETLTGIAKGRTITDLKFNDDSSEIIISLDNGRQIRIRGTDAFDFAESSAWLDVAATDPSEFTGIVLD